MSFDQQEHNFDVSSSLRHKNYLTCYMQSIISTAFPSLSPGYLRHDSWTMLCRRKLDQFPDEGWVNFDAHTHLCYLTHIFVREMGICLFR